ncbi:uncharacterized protein C2845_PM03G07800 [Panicum miliaceum]|uniref:Uncharacterized protein n=1 Tax=Panicum miliaceum TaxID=4540 RepID=A0A3L6TD54_PANMI|nr:uncharacterized protein C2845_PM03G07800 [Panicum miliaceum]
MSSSSSSPPTNPLLANSVTEKLTKANHALWKAQVQSAMRGACLEGHLTGATAAPAAEIVDKEGKKTPNPAFEEWEARDQQILSFLFASITQDVMTQIASSTTASEAWGSIEAMFASQTRARVLNLRIALTTTKKGTMYASDYFAKMKGFADDMAAAGRPLAEYELVEYIISSLGGEFESLVSALITRVEPISVEELYSQLLTFETRMDLIHGGDHSSASWAGRGGRSSNQGRGAGHGGCGQGSSAPGHGRGNGNNTGARQGGYNSNR